MTWSMTEPPRVVEPRVDLDGGGVYAPIQRGCLMRLIFAAIQLKLMRFFIGGRFLVESA